MAEENENENEKEKAKAKDYFDNIEALFDKYQNNSYMLQRLCYHITDILPSTLETEEKNHEKRIERTAFLTKEQQTFIQIFLSKNQYYYLSNNNCFYQYDGKTYRMVSEDDIQYQLLSTISKDRTLMEWKHKTKINIIKQIKERNLFKSIPETATIQKIINLLYPALFATKGEVKYFLTIIGDSIHKKHNDLVFLTKPKTKKFLNEIDNICYMVTGYANITSNFVTKYNETHNFNNCRLINIADSILFDNLKELLTKNGLDFLCVATHYSDRYGNSDQYVLSSEELSSYTLYLKNNSQMDIFNKFCEHSIEVVANEPSNKKFSIQWKNMHFIWKLFISKHSLPSVIYINTFKKLLKEKYAYDETTDTFYNVTSKYMPFVSNFIQFWENTIAASTNGEFDYEIEIDELCGLYKKWIHDNSETCYSAGNANEHDVLKIINHFFPSFEVIENKYILNVQCSLWDKIGDMNKALEKMKEHYKESILFNQNAAALIPFDEIYSYYTKNKQTKFTISKRYFEKYLDVALADFIEFDNFVSISWLSS